MPANNLLTATVLLLSGIGGFGLANWHTEKRLSYTEAQKTEFAASVGSKYLCAQACAGSGTPYCRTIPLEAQYATGLRSLASRLKSGGDVVPKAALMSDFGVTSDPCNRGDSKLTQGRWSNVGQECLMGGDIDIFGDSHPVRFELAVPSEVTFITRSDQLGSHYSSDRGAISLRISDEGINNDWGGALREIIDTGSSVLLQMPRGCLKVEG